MSATPAFLADDEIREIVSPLKQPAAIVRWFRENGFGDLKVRPNGLPLIPRAYFEAVAVGGTVKSGDKSADREEMPDVAALLARVGKNAKSKTANR